MPNIVKNLLLCCIQSAFYIYISEPDKMEAESQSSLGKNESENGKEETTMQKASHAHASSDREHQVSLQKSSQMCVIDQEPLSNTQ